MHRHDDHSPSSSLLASTAHGRELFPQTRAESMAKVRLTTLDRALEGHFGEMKHELFLKLDVQGFEDRVLRGATRLLTQCSACLLEVNVDPLFEGQADFSDLVRILGDADYRYAGNMDQTYAVDGRVIYLDALFIRR
jgi:hypothetical protein